MEQTAREFLRALRGTRSQVAFSRKLGYRSNVAADWEQGRRFPTASEMLRAATIARCDVQQAFEAFHPETAPAIGQHDGAGIAAWLNASRGTTPAQELAHRAERSRHAVGRWLRGDAEPRVPDFFRLVDALTGRLPEFVAAFVDIDAVPSMAHAHERMRRSRRVGIEHPWAVVVLLALETEGYRSLAKHDDAWLSRLLGLDVDRVRACLTALVAAGVVGVSSGRFVVEGNLTMDTKAFPQARAMLRSHWAHVSAERADDLRDDDLMSFNLFNVSHEDLRRIRELQRGFFREVRGIVAASEGPECVALLQVQLVTWR